MAAGYGFRRRYYSRSASLRSSSSAGVPGVWLAAPPAGFLRHYSRCLFAQFHNGLIGGLLFGAFAGYTYWFPKAFGFKLHEGLGQAAFWCWLVGFYVAFMPLYVLGLLGMTRRMQHY